MSQPYTGGCLCGAVRYEAKGEPETCIACHCNFCQKISGSAHSYLAYFAAENVSLSGPFNEYEFHSTETGRVLKMHFCPKCGVSVVGSTSAAPEGLAIHIGTLDDKDRISVRTHIRTSSKHHSIRIPEDVDEYSEWLRDSAGPTRASRKS